MHQHPAATWNAIAETQELQTEWAELMFPLPQEEMDEALERETAKLAEEMGSRMVAVAYLRVMPLLWEAEAIEAFQATGAPLADGMTAMGTVQEAVIAASRDYVLTMQDQQRLEEKLRTPPTV